MSHEDKSYAEYLDEITSRLTLEGIAHEVVNTGGNVMCVEIALEDGAYVGVTPGEEHPLEDEWTVCHYYGEGDSEGTYVGGRDLTPDEAITRIREVLRVDAYQCMACGSPAADVAFHPRGHVGKVEAWACEAHESEVEATLRSWGAFLDE